MKTKTKAVAAALTGTALGVSGLAVIAMPAGAQDAPALPSVSAEELVSSVLTAEPSALAGTVTVDNQLGLPAVPGLDALTAGTARVYNDGAGKTKLSLQSEGSERTIVHDGATVWDYDSADRTATKLTVPEGEGSAGKRGQAAGEGRITDPAQVTATVLEHVRATSTVAVDGTATVADRPAYELVLTPKPEERTLLREVRVAVDSATRTPLQLSVLANGSADPALQVGFSEVEFTPQPAETFAFTPPQGTTVTEKQPGDERPGAQAPGKAPEQAPIEAPRIIGEGWDTVVTTRVPAELMAGAPAQGRGDRDDDAGEQGMPMDPKALLDQFGKPVSGAFGSGHVVTTKVATALITEDGRVAVGAVPEQVLIEALGSR
ncbi:hypothetical protein CFN78_09090 [Amycolatopsis antarctica]|uniref:MucB/RseB N-terminal domain-containing protein n=1 Tax=Amycolatopsis antarctica TaxID=1854586 RepID=A0A263D8E5_9PSEU|nr:hypothetical protein [Amycolatopsis antarctica]OZM73665.1 hypothetical protein CFN78_09090 [Amycolatopsis antarctica]